MTNNDFREFQTFLGSSSEPSKELKQEIFTTIENLLHPSPVRTIGKFSALHAAGSFCTLILCPQFGISLGGVIGPVVHSLMTINPALCFFVCGLLWMLPGQFLVARILTLEEIRLLRKWKIVSPAAFLFLSLLFFACLGKVTFDSALAFWLTGAILVSGMFVLLSGARLARLNRRFLQHA